MGTDEKPKLTASCAISEGSHTWTQRTGVTVCSKPRPRTVLCSLHKLFLLSSAQPHLSCTKACQIPCTSCAVLPCPCKCLPHLSSKEGWIALHQQPVLPITPPAPAQSCDHPLSILQPGHSSGTALSPLQGEGGEPEPALTNLLIKNLGRA